VPGVRVLRPGEDPGEDEPAADLVIDASGRGSRTPVWLRELGYPAPEEESVEIGVTYATRRFRRTRDQLPGAKGAVVTMCPDNPRAGALACEEEDRWIVTLAGMRGDDPPLTPGSFAAFAESLADKRIAARQRSARWVDCRVEPVVRVSASSPVSNRSASARGSSLSRVLRSPASSPANVSIASSRRVPSPAIP